jgi:class 3 adenylate cyclase/predicted ATPase
MTSTGATIDVGAWLRGLGLEQYEAAFRENAVNEKILPSLTAEDLKDLGVGLVGHRRALLDAIAALRAEATAKAPLAEAPSTLPKPNQDTAERRQVTVMFSDLVGSTALSARMDPEDLREVISGYQKCVAETVERFGGFVAKYMGDGVLVYFGYPHAHEDDAERAVRAGLALITAVTALQASAPLQTRVGVATGLVVVGDLIGAGSAHEQAVVGETPNLAARLQGIAEPNTLVIAESTRKLLGNLFDLQDLRGQDLKGIEGPVRAWAALRPASVESRFEALHGGGLTALVGREEELELLLRRWSRTKSSEGQVVLLFGEAGIGKSRLTAALLEKLSGEPHTRLRYFCSPQHTDSALYPIISQMERVAGLAHGDTAQVKVDKLDALLAQTATSKQDAALFAEMLSLRNDGRYAALELSPQQRRQKTLEALTTQTETLSQQKTVLMIFEDAHWTDPTSLEALSRVVDRLRSLRVLLIVTFRPEFDSPWIGRPYVTALTLNRLAQRDIETVIDNVIGNKLIPASIRQDIIERTDGIPLFVEEMTKAVLEAGSEGAVQQTVASFPSPALAVPASLQASLMARLDRLGAAKELAQVGAAIGREFSHAILSAVVSKPEPALVSALHRLIAAGLLFRQGVPPHARYLFKHALVQDAAYGTLFREPRRALHARIAETLERLFTEIAESQPELLARHCTEAGLTEKAADLWGKAGQRSLARSAVVEAVGHLTRGLDQIATLPPTPALRRQQISLQVALANALMHVKGYAAPEPKAAFDQARVFIERAEALGEPLEDPLLLFSVLWGFWSASFVAFNGDMVRELAVQYMALAEKQGSTVPLMVGHRLKGMSLLHTGDIVGGRAHFDRAIALYDSATHRSLAPRFGQDIRVAALGYRSLALWLLGYPEAALADSTEALKDAREIGHAASLMYARNCAVLVDLQSGMFAAANALIDELSTLANEKGIMFLNVFAQIYQGFALALSGEAASAVQKIISNIPVYRAMGSTLNMPLHLMYLAIAHADLGEADDAWRCIGEAMTTMETTKEAWMKAEVHRVAGEIACKSPESNVLKAEKYFDRALAIARKQRAKAWELRAALSMARLWRDQGKRNEARDLLAPVYGWFTEGFDTRDLEEAKALLEELAA